MDSFKTHIDEASALKFYNLLPKKVRHTINRIRNKDKYKAALYLSWWANLLIACLTFLGSKSKNLRAVASSM